MNNTIVIYVVVLVSLVILVMLCVLMYFSKPKAIYDKVYLMNLKRRPDRLDNFLDHYKVSDIKHNKIIKFDVIDV